MPEAVRSWWPLGIILALLIMTSCAENPASSSGQNNDLIQKLTITDMCYISGMPLVYGTTGPGSYYLSYIDTLGQVIQLNNQTGHKGLQAIISPPPRCDG